MNEEIGFTLDKIREAQIDQTDLNRLDLRNDIINLKLNCRLHEHIVF